MENKQIEFVGAACGHHGNYTFYKAFKYRKNGLCKILSLGEFFFVKLWNDSDLVCIGELQLLWEDKNNNQILASLRLYFLPENTPDGRSDDHGEDEVVAISEKVVLRVEDLLQWITDSVSWDRGLLGVWEKECVEEDPPVLTNVGSPLECDTQSADILYGMDGGKLDLKDVNKEKQILAENEVQGSVVLILSYARYCRYRCILKRVEGVSNLWLRNSLVISLGGFAVPCPDTYILFCKDTFEYPELEDHELLCTHLAPKLKGRPRKKCKKRSLSPGSESNESESSSSASSIYCRVKPKQTLQPKNGLRRALQPALSDSKGRGRPPTKQEMEFLDKLNVFMNQCNTPIDRVPHLGFKKIQLFIFFNKVQSLGGYDAVTGKKMWKHIYDELGGHPGNTSAATCTRRHYERLLLPYELHWRGGIRSKDKKTLLPLKAKEKGLGFTIQLSACKKLKMDIPDGKKEKSCSPPVEKAIITITPPLNNGHSFTPPQPMIAMKKEEMVMKVDTKVEEVKIETTLNIPKVRVKRDELLIRTHPPDLKLKDLMTTAAPNLTGKSCLKDLASIASRIEHVPKERHTSEPPASKRMKMENSERKMSAPYALSSYSERVSTSGRPSVIQHTPNPNSKFGINIPDPTPHNNLLQYYMVTSGQSNGQKDNRPPRVVQSVSPYTQTGALYRDPNEFVHRATQERIEVPTGTILDLSKRKRSHHAVKSVEQVVVPQERELDLSVRRRSHHHPKDAHGFLKSAGIRLTPSVEIKPVNNPREPLFPDFKTPIKPEVLPLPLSRDHRIKSKSIPVAPMIRERTELKCLPDPLKASVTISVTTASSVAKSSPSLPSPSITIEPQPSTSSPLCLPYLSYPASKPSTTYPPMWDPSYYAAALYNPHWYGASYPTPPLQMPLSPALSVEHLNMYKELFQRGIVHGSIPYPQHFYPPSGSKDSTPTTNSSGMPTSK